MSSDVIGGGPHHAKWLEMRYEILAERGLDHTLARCLRGRTREELTASADALASERQAVQGETA
jgi:hypothetical protein